MLWARPIRHRVKTRLPRSWAPRPEKSGRPVGQRNRAPGAYPASPKGAGLVQSSDQRWTGHYGADSHAGEALVLALCVWACASSSRWASQFIVGKRTSSWPNEKAKTCRCPLRKRNTQTATTPSGGPTKGARGGEPKEGGVTGEWRRPGH